MPATTPHGRESTDHVDLRVLFYIVCERIWVVALCLFLCAAATVVYLIRAPRIYAAKVVLQVEQEEAKVLNIERVQAENLQSLESVKTVEQTLHNRALLERILVTNNLEADPRFVPPNPVGPPPTRERLVNALGNMVDSKLRKGTRLIDLTVEHTDAELTATIANSLVQEYIRQTFDQNVAASEVASVFLQSEAKRLAIKLEASENALQAYKEKSQTTSLEDQQNTIGQVLKDLSTRITEAKSQMIMQETLYTQMKEIGDDTAKLLLLPAASADAHIQEIRSNISRIESDIAQLRQRYKEKHPKFIQAQSQLDEWNKSLRRAALNLPRTAQSAYEIAKSAEAALERAKQEHEVAALELTRQTMRYNQLLRDVESDRALYNSVINRIKETSLTKEIQPSKVRIIQPAKIPERPVKPEKLRVMFFGTFAGLSIGILLVFFLNALDRSIKSVDQAEEFLGLTVLATVPKISGNDDSERRLITSEESKSPEAEAFRTLRTSLSMLGRKDDRRTFLFTSAIPSEGKTFCSLNYAASLAQQGLRTLLIDGDLRRPMVEKSLRANNQRGFGVTDYITGSKPFEAIVVPTEVANLSYVPAGSHTPNPAELLAKTTLDGLIDEALLHFDRVVVDSAPIHAVSDTLLMLNRVQTVCLVLRTRKTAKYAVKRAAQLLLEAGAPLAGVIMNQMPRSRGVGYYYDSYYNYSYYGYYSDQEKKDRPKLAA